MFGWLKEANEDLLSDSWTPERTARFQLLDLHGGDVAKAEAALAAHRRKRFARYLIEHGVLSEWRRSDG